MIILLEVAISVYALLMSYAQPKFIRPYAWVSGLGAGIVGVIIIELILPK